MSSKKSVIGLLAGLLFVAASDCPWKLGLSKLAPRLFSPAIFLPKVHAEVERVEKARLLNKI